MRVTVLCVVAACGCDRREPLANDHASATGALVGRACAPDLPWLSYELAREGGDVVLCASRIDDADTSLPLDVPVACWTVDVATAALVWRPPAIPPGHLARMPVVHGVVAGHAIGPASWSTDAAHSDALVAPSTDGRHVAISTSMDRAELVVVDTVARTSIRIADPEPSSLVQLAFVGDRIYRLGQRDGYTAASLAVWRADGERLADPEPGALSVLDAGTIGILLHDGWFGVVLAPDTLQVGDHTLVVPPDVIAYTSVRLDDGRFVALRGRDLAIYAGTAWRHSATLVDCLH